MTSDLAFLISVVSDCLEIESRYGLAGWQAVVHFDIHDWLDLGSDLAAEIRELCKSQEILTTVSEIRAN